MKTVYLTQKQIDLIKESILSDKMINLDIANPLNLNVELFNKIIKNGYEEAKSCFADNIEQHSFKEIVDKLNKLIFICQKKEEPIRNELEKICSDIAMSMFELNNKEIELECNLVNEISNTKNFHIKPNTDEDVEYDSLEQKNNIDSEKIKHCFITALTVGASMNITDLLLKKCVSDIFELDEELPHLYSKIVKINEYLLYLNKEKITDKNNMQGAYEEVTISKLNDNIKIKSEGIIFPFLLNETIRGFIEAISCNALPDNDFETQQIIDNCDVLENEPSYMVIGKQLWKKFIGDNKIEISEYESLFDNLFKINGDDFISLMNELVNSTKLGKEQIAKLIDKSKYNKHYSDFEKDLQMKRNEKKIIIDNDYLSEEELNNDFFLENNDEDLSKDVFNLFESFKTHIIAEEVYDFIDLDSTNNQTIKECEKVYDIINNYLHDNIINKDMNDIERIVVPNNLFVDTIFYKKNNNIIVTLINTNNIHLADNEKIRDSKNYINKYINFKEQDKRMNYFTIMISCIVYNKSYITDIEFKKNVYHEFSHAYEDIFREKKKFSTIRQIDDKVHINKILPTTKEKTNLYINYLNSIIYFNKKSEINALVSEFSAELTDFYYGKLMFEDLEVAIKNTNCWKRIIMFSNYLNILKECNNIEIQQEIIRQYNDYNSLLKNKKTTYNQVIKELSYKMNDTINYLYVKFSKILNKKYDFIRNSETKL